MFYRPAAILGLAAGILAVLPALGAQEDRSGPVAAAITGDEAGWRAMEPAEFVNVNCDADTWQWRDDGVLACSGTPVGVMRTVEPFRNFELMLEWKHLKKAGNSGVFIWSPRSSLDILRRGELPEGIECQVLDHGYTEEYESSTGGKADWFTTHGDVFPVGESVMTPFPPVAPDGRRSFPSANHSLGVGEWNHYYIRAINGEVRLWVNGHEVSGGTACDPSRGHIALESEGSPIEFRRIRIRVLPD